MDGKIASHERSGIPSWWMAYYRITALKDVTVEASVWVQSGTKLGGRQMQEVETVFNLKAGKSRIDVSSVASVHSANPKIPAAVNPDLPNRIGISTQVPGLLWIEKLKD